MAVAAKLKKNKSTTSTGAAKSKRETKSGSSCGVVRGRRQRTGEAKMKGGEGLAPPRKKRGNKDESSGTPVFIYFSLFVFMCCFLYYFWSFEFGFGRVRAGRKNLRWGFVPLASAANAGEADESFQVGVESDGTTAVLLKKGDYDSPLISLMEEHNEAIAEWNMARNAGLLSSESPITVVHFDSHPDMSMSTLKFAEIEKTSLPHLPTKVEIDEFITAATRMGLVEHIIWVRPPWADTLTFDGTIDFDLALDPDTGTLVHDYALPYYILTRFGRIYRPQLHGERTSIRLTVVRHDNVAEKVPALLKGLDPSRVVVDFDLDYLSTNHPGLTAAPYTGVSFKELVSLTRKEIRFVARVNKWLHDSFSSDSDDGDAPKDVDASLFNEQEFKTKLYERISGLNAKYDKLQCDECDESEMPDEALLAAFRNMMLHIDTPENEVERLAKMVHNILPSDVEKRALFKQHFLIFIVLPYGAPDLAQVKTMVKQFKDAMKGTMASLGGRPPAFFTACRSVGSGFTPKGKAPRFLKYYLEAMKGAFLRTPRLRTRDGDVKVNEAEYQTAETFLASFRAIE